MSPFLRFPRPPLLLWHTLQRTCEETRIVRGIGPVKKDLKEIEILQLLKVSMSQYE